MGFLVYYAYFGLIYYQAGRLWFQQKKQVRPELGLAVASEPPSATVKVVDRRQRELIKGSASENIPAIEDNVAPKKAALVGADSEQMRPAAKMAETDDMSIQGDGKPKGKDEKPVKGDAVENPALTLSNEAIKELRQRIERAVETGISWEEIKKQLHGVLVRCKELMGTEYESSINSFIERRCRDAFGQALAKGGWVELWGEQPQKRKNVDEQEEKQSVPDES